MKLYIKKKGSANWVITLILFVFASDLSDNSIHDTIPYQLPPNLTSL